MTEDSRLTHRAAYDLPEGCQSLADRISRLEVMLADKTGVPDGGFTDEKLAAIATMIYRARCRRMDLFGDELFGEPAWDMLLDLFIANVKGARVGTTSLCIAAGVSVPTGLRWIERLEAKGLLRRSDAPDDARLTIVQLTRSGHSLMRQYVSEGVSRAEMPTT